ETIPPHMPAQCPPPSRPVRTATPRIAQVIVMRRSSAVDFRCRALKEQGQRARACRKHPEQEESRRVGREPAPCERLANQRELGGIENGEKHRLGCTCGKKRRPQDPDECSGSHAVLAYFSS